MKQRKIFALIFLILQPVSLFCETGQNIIDRLRNRAVWIDAVRFPDAVLLEFINNRQRLIGTVGRTKEAGFQFVPVIGLRFQVLPADFFLFESAEINPDPEANIIDAPWVGLSFVPRRDLTSASFPEKARPAGVSIWKDSLVLNRPSATGLDTIYVAYFGYPTVLATAAATVDLPTEYLPLLEDYCMIKCYERVSMTIPDTLDRSIGYLEIELLGRPRDDK